ncbi:hypothetical protein V511_10520 [Mesotoga sp. Brook.08.YT.4.2.5.1]|uniref:hypothetical protein n=1 Tax=unclassified Mesotoga TaxID=1184398 RepID=UPI000A5034ED|nr:MULTISPECIES: hypothetical protein [unclassified Mesotoga]MDD3460848.1 hypothetical protein [Mesotoga sp.]PNE20045.1 hypothetical protein V511_10520 [Mesotoga sp. Brook.08.YT.4.2.5.1]PVD16863.1 hypothetical protein V512_008030 [Mesotoga sp. Brook.08.105.5.1]RAO97305.1 hypothetical protein M388_00635 [Mesotoga sp. Brook.08.YT.4.2.5.4.]RDI91576.1 hypothetical protein Q502_11315 [Mesotoga sp. Brook.08.YT.4.2.5.2.]
MKLWLPFLVVVTAFLAISYIWGFNFFRSPSQVFIQYERAMLDYTAQIRQQQEAGSKAGLNEREIAFLRELAIVELEGDMKSLVFDFQKDWPLMQRHYIQYAHRSGDWFIEGLSGSLYTQDDPEYSSFLELYELQDDPDSYCLIFIPGSSEKNVFTEFSGARVYYLQRTIWGYRIEWSRSLIDLILDVAISSASV